MVDGTKRRSSRQAASRKRSLYVDPDTDDDFDIDSHEGDAQLELEPAPPLPPKRRRIARPAKRVTRSKNKSKKSIKSVFKVGKPRKPSCVGGDVWEKREFTGPSDGRIPQWTLLPVNILRDIFVFASQPIHHNTNEACANVAWLLRAALTCRAFALPALEAYYQSPAMLNSLHLHELLHLLNKSREPRYLDYNLKVRSLYLDVRRLAYVAHNRPAFDLVPLIAKIPQLHDLEILHPKDEPPYRPMKIQRWNLRPEELFSTMDAQNIRLRSWRWTRDMIPRAEAKDVYQLMTTTHQSKAFSRLDKLTVCGFNYENSSEPMVADDSIKGSGALPGLASSISELPALTDLTFVTCDIVMNKFLQRLPTSLQRLELCNCLEITSNMLRDFFRSSGSELRVLVLNHNAALNLSFLQGLATFCPRLEALKVDMHYYSERLLVNDAAALYEELLSIDETPSWPSNLRRLELVHASKWTPEAAQNLFRSLLESAPELNDLRHIVLHAHINIPWRDRVGFRDQWIERLRRVYLRPPAEPKRYLGSLRQFRLWKQAQHAEVIGSEKTDELGHGLADHISGSRRVASHVQVSPHETCGDTDVYSESDDVRKMLRQPRRSKRVAESQIIQACKAATPTPEAESEDDGDGCDWRRQPEKFIHGLCDVVDVRIDNQRPRENQWTEGDFLDSEKSGDEDWNEDAASDQEDTYAW